MVGRIISKTKTLGQVIKCYLVGINPNKIFLHWATHNSIKDNWGDALNPVLFKCLTGKKPVHYKMYKNKLNKPAYTMIGSYLQNLTDPNIVVWGTGFMNQNSKIKVTPREICAVRGPLSRQNFLENNIECPNVFGDAAILYPIFYQPKSITKKYKFGFIAHHRDRGTELTKVFDRPDVLNINIKSPIQQVVNEIHQCEYIISSTLHGIIASDAYGIPSIWVKLTDRPLGDGFKFKDYFASVGRETTEPIQVKKDLNVEELINRYTDSKPYLDVEKLIDSCPFIGRKRKSEIKNKAHLVYPSYHKEC